MSNDAYAPPRAPLGSETGSPVALYTLNQIWIAAWIGSPLAASLLVAHNFRAAGHRDAGRRAIVLGVLATAALFGLSAWLPANRSYTSLPIVVSVLVRMLAQRQQGELIETHVAAGLPVQSWWRVLGISVAVAVALVALLAALVFATLQP